MVAGSVDSKKLRICKYYPNSGFRMVFRKFSEIPKNKAIFSQYNISYNYEYFFFQSAF